MLRCDDKINHGLFTADSFDFSDDFLFLLFIIDVLQQDKRVRAIIYNEATCSHQ